MRPAGIRGGIGRFLVAPCAIGLGLVLTATGQAEAQQQPAPPDINHIMQQQRQIVQQQEQARRDELERQRQPQAQAPAQQAAPEAQTPAQAAHCVNVNRFVFEGGENLKDGVREEVNKKFAGKCMSIVDILTVVRTITNVYVSEGYPTTRVYTPEQDLSKGTLRVKVIEGRTQSVELSDGGKPRVGLDTAFPLLVGERLYIRDIEQGLDQINRLPGYEAKIAIKPGDGEGQSKIVVDTKHPFLPLVTTTMDNLGLKTTGEWQLGTTIAAGDLLGLYDSWALSYKSSSPIYGPEIGSDQYTASVSVPFGYWTVLLSGSYFDYKSVIHMPSVVDPTGTAAVASTGNSVYATADIERVLHRDQDSKTKVDAFLNWKDTESYLAGEFMGMQSPTVNVLGIRLSHTHRIFGGLFDGNINGQFGVPMFGSMTNEQADARGISNRPEFSKVAGDISFYRPIDMSGLNSALKDVKLAYSFKASGQYSPDFLLPSEQLTLGGFYTVRGYKTQSLSGGNGGFTRNELIYTMPYWLPDEFKSAFAQVDLFAGLDAGSVWRNDINPLSVGNVAGLAAGVRLSRGPLFGEVSYQHPLSAPQSIAMEDQLVVQTGLLFKW
jgi:hemolysin activation/secretion protein